MYREEGEFVKSHEEEIEKKFPREKQMELLGQFMSRLVQPSAPPSFWGRVKGTLMRRLG